VTLATEFSTPLDRMSLHVFGCPDCEQPFQVDSLQAGQQVRCPGCNAVVQIPAVTADATESQPPIPDAAQMMIAAQQASDSPSQTKPPLPVDQAADDGEDAQSEPETDVEEEVGVFEPQNVDHLLPPRFATLDPAFFYRRGNQQDQVLLPQAGGGVQAVSNRIVTVVHKGQEYQLISSDRYRRNLDIIVNSILVVVAAGFVANTQPHHSQPIVG